MIRSYIAENYEIPKNTGENTIAITDDYFIHIDLSKYGDIAVEQNVRINANEQ